VACSSKHEILSQPRGIFKILQWDMPSMYQFRIRESVRMLQTRIVVALAPHYFSLTAASPSAECTRNPDAIWHVE
jgi:hypothetical protein